LGWYLTSLDDLDSKEKEKALSELPSALPQSERQNLCTIDDREWGNAWATKFHGTRLEYKLHLNACAVATNSEKKRMSRIIPLVQASGTGKSRLAEE
jgi:hypothetical protein